MHDAYPDISFACKAVTGSPARGPSGRPAELLDRSPTAGEWSGPAANTSPLFPPLYHVNKTTTAKATTRASESADGACGVRAGAAPFKGAAGYGEKLIRGRDER